MRNGLKCLLLASIFVLPSMGMAQNIDIEFGSYGACPVYYIAGTDEYELCAQQRRQFDAGIYEKRAKYEMERLEKTFPNERPHHFIIREHFE